MSGCCKHCGSNSIVHDDISANLFCSSSQNLSQNSTASMPRSAVSTAQKAPLSVSALQVRALNTLTKKRKSTMPKTPLMTLSTSLLLSPSKCSDIKTMIAQITENEFGQGDWFPILMGACAYVVMWKDNKSLPIAEVASVVGCDIYELGRMFIRVVDFLGLKGSEEFLEFDIVVAFERAARNCGKFSGLGRDVVERMRKQGVFFFIQCAVQWFLTTGRKPLPVVAELNEVDLRIEDVALEVHAAVSTCRLRYKELLESLVKVAQVLPRGKDVTRKVVEEKGGGIDLGDAVSECLSKNVEHGTSGNCVENDSLYFEPEENRGFVRSRGESFDRVKISHECLSLIYTEYLNEMGHEKFMEGSGEVPQRKGMRGFEFLACRDWWEGKSELSKKLLLKQILEKDVGLDALPPSFVNGCKVYKRRKEKINAAKLRISRIKHPLGTDLGEGGDIGLSECVNAGKKRKGKRVKDIDWEDFIIEALLLHEVKEEEIEKGHYNTLLDLHVFNGGILPEKRKGKRVKDIDWEDFIIEALLLHEVKEEEIEKGHYNTLLDLHVFNGGILPENFPCQEVERHNKPEVELKNNGRIVVTASTVEHSIKDSLECGRSCNAKAAAVIGEVLAMRLRVEGLEQGQGRGIHVDLNKEIEKKGFKNRTKIWPIVNSLRNNGVNLFWMMMITESEVFDYGSYVGRKAILLVAGVKIRRGKFGEVAFECRDGCFCGSAKSKPEALLAASTRGLVFPLCLFRVTICVKQQGP
nr:plant-specific tfiib-related protein ptf2 [Quercus suber]